MKMLTQKWYAGDGAWRLCLSGACGTATNDWAADSLTGVLYERWKLTGDASLLGDLRQLEAANPGYGPCAGSCTRWSDEPLWDAVAGVREYDVTGDPVALDKAILDYQSPTQSSLYALGACPAIDYQQPNGVTGTKTLETTANRVLAGVLLYERTGVAAYLADAVAQYAAARTYFLDPQLPLYTVWVADNGTACSQVPHRFYASVNGRMIEAGLELASAAGNPQYAADAAATAQAITLLNDASGIFADLQADSDIEEPLVSAMLKLSATSASARTWILQNAAAAAHARNAAGSYPRLFDGPPDEGTTLWDTNGGFALVVAAASLAPTSSPSAANPWTGNAIKPIALTALPTSYAFTGSGIALYGTLGQARGHAHVAIDGVTMADQTGIWQGLSFAGPIANSVLFAWRWPSSGAHVLTFTPGEYDINEGGSFLDVVGALVTP